MPDTEAGKRLLLGLPSQGTGLVALNTEALTEAIAATEREAWLQGHDEAVRLQAEYDRDAVAAERARITPPLGTRLILVAGDLLQWIGTRTESGDLLTAEWGEPDERGWYEPVLTSHHDDNLVSAERARIRAAVEGMPLPVGPHFEGIELHPEIIAAVLRIIEGETP